MVPGLSTPLTFLRIRLVTVCCLAVRLCSAFIISVGSVGSCASRLLLSLTATSAEMDTSLKRTSIWGSALPSDRSRREAMCSCSANGPRAINALPSPYP
ncbi:hypothetical protein PF010_g29459, partial [Phytophthora fragariae]